MKWRRFRLIDRNCIFKEYCPAYSEWSEKCKQSVCGQTNCIPLLLEHYMSSIGETQSRRMEMYCKYNNFMNNINDS